MAIRCCQHSLRMCLASIHLKIRSPNRFRCGATIFMGAMPRIVMKPGTDDIVIKDTHRGLWYEDGVLKRVLEAGRYELPKGPEFNFLGHRRHARVEVLIVDVRERELTIKGQEILTSDK